MIKLKSLPLLHVAAFKGQNEQIDHLVKKEGISINSCTDEGDTVYHTATRGSQLKTIIHLSYEYRLDMSILNLQKQGLLHIAAKTGWEEGVRYFVEKIGLGLNGVDGEGFTALELAAIHGKNVIVELFLDEYHVKFKNKPGNISILHYVARYAPLSTCQLLVEKYQLDPCMKTDNGLTALDYAKNSLHEGKINYFDDLLNITQQAKLTISFDQLHLNRASFKVYKVYHDRNKLRH